VSQSGDLSGQPVVEGASTLATRAAELWPQAVTPGALHVVSTPIGHLADITLRALAVLRAVEEECAKRRAAENTVRVNSPAALYLLNNKRDRLADIESRWGVTVLFDPDDTLHGAETRIERSKTPPAPVSERPAALRMDYAEEEPEETAEESAEEAAEGGTAEERARRPRRRRRGRNGRREGGAPEQGEAGSEGEEEGEAEAPAATARAKASAASA
jgi:ribonuclease E